MLFHHAVAVAALQESAQMMPQLYIPGPQGTAFGWRVLGMWLLAALWSSIVCFYLPAMALTPAAVSSNGHMIDIWATGTLAYTLIIITVRPDTPDTPDTSDTPDTPDTPDAPYAPDTPDTPDPCIACASRWFCPPSPY